MFLVICLFVLAFLVYHLGVNRILGLPPGPPPLPLIGNTLSFKWDFDRVLLDWKARYGRIFTVWLPYPIVVIGDHKNLQEHIVRNGDVFIDKQIPVQTAEIMSGGLLGLVFEANDMVKEQRKFALKSLHEIGFGSAALEDTVHHYAQEVVDRWRKSGSSPVNVAENIEKAVGNMIWNVTFGVTQEFDNDIVPEFRQLLTDVNLLLAGPHMMLINQFPFLRKLDPLFGGKVKQMQGITDNINRMVGDAVALTEKSFNNDDLPRSYVEAFLREMKKNEDRGKSMGNFHLEQLKASASGLWGAGFDTTVGLLRMCCLQLVNHPEAQRKLQAEVDALGDRTIRYEDQKLLPYMCAFLQEVYRLTNVLPVNFIRKTSQDTNIEGFSIARGTSVLPQFAMVHLDPSEFERPDFFCAERHIDKDGRFVKDPPFSVGKRACLGETLARMEIFVMLAAFVQNCHFFPVEKMPPPVEFDQGFTRSVKQYMVKIEPRN